MAAADQEERGALLATAESVSSILDTLGAASTRMSDLCVQATETADAVAAEMKRRGQPGQSAQPAELMEWALLTQWVQLAEQFAAQYLAITIQQGAQIARARRGPQLADVRQMRNPPNPRMLRP